MEEFFATLIIILIKAFIGLLILAGLLVVVWVLVFVLAAIMVVVQHVRRPK